MKPDAKLWRVGTLKYTRGGLVVLFLWLLSNDLCLMLMEQVAPQLTPLLFRDHGASNVQIALFMSTFGGILTLWINPFVSAWSDRHRSPLGRRRPFLLAASPVAALALCAIPFAPRIGSALGLSPFANAVTLIGIVYLIYASFNSILMAIFAYYFWDVVPEEFLGRFSALTKMVSSIVSFFWNFFLFGLAAKHINYVYVGVALFFLVVYVTSVWNVKEGEYPPVTDSGSRNGVWPQIRAYFGECFSKPYYLWIFAAALTFQISNISNMYQIFYFRDELHIALDLIGKIRSWPALGIAILAYPLGVLVDRRKPIRLVAPVLAVWSLLNLCAFLFLHGPASMMVFLTLITICSFLFGISYSVLNVEVFPREKLGQFCSAAAISSQIASLILAIPLGMLLDALKDYRYVFLWSAFFEAMAALLFFKVYLNWKHHRQPDAGIR